jgi:hypothetical protein
MSTRTLPARLASLASRRASSEAPPSVALTTSSPWAAASAKLPSFTSGCCSYQIRNGGLP